MNKTLGGLGQEVLFRIDQSGEKSAANFQQDWLIGSRRGLQGKTVAARADVAVSSIEQLPVLAEGRIKRCYRARLHDLGSSRTTLSSSWFFFGRPLTELNNRQAHGGQSR